MATAINQQRKIWQQMPNLVYEMNKEYLHSKSINRYPNRITKSNILSFIVDWQVIDIQRNPQQLSLFFKE